MHYLIGSLSLLVIWLVIFIFQKKLRKEILIASIIITPSGLSEVFSILGFIKHWNLSHLSSIVILGVPLEEILWAIGTGALLNPIYEYLLSIRLSERR